ncbi:unnamed protein product [Orchesella dallaii]|uniref:C-type lectin domain-containing protein n=1 Tax=Orchesella dallaii TaxID=48710 RepID=A0ABP1PR72_9HEXA
MSKRDNEIETVQERLCIWFSPYFGIVVNLITVMALGLSVHHDVKWNSYTNVRFNLNIGFESTKMNARDYMDVESQQEWIDLIQRQHLLETIVICLVVVAAFLKGIHIIASSSIPPANRMPQALNTGGFVFLLSAFLEGTSAILIITSIVAADDDSNQIMELIHGPKTNWPDVMNWTAPVANEVDLYMNVYCNTHENKWVAPKQCQLTFAKVLATVRILSINDERQIKLDKEPYEYKALCELNIQYLQVFCLLNALISFTVSFNLFCNNTNQVEPFIPKRARRILGSSGIRKEGKSPLRKQRVSFETNQIDLECFEPARLATDNDTLRFHDQLLASAEGFLLREEAQL